jgi:hypothetical protein
MKARRSRYQNGSIKRVKRAKGFAWEVRFRETKNGKRHQRCQTFDGLQYPTKAAVRKAAGPRSKRKGRKITLGADTQYQEAEFIRGLRKRKVAPRVSEYVEGNLGKNSLPDEQAHTCAPCRIAGVKSQLRWTPTVRAGIGNKSLHCRDSPHKRRRKGVLDPAIVPLDLALEVPLLGQVNGCGAQSSMFCIRNDALRELFSCGG